MADSRHAPKAADYAHAMAATASGRAAAGRRRFRPRLWPTLAAALALALCSAAGQWQWAKARAKNERQQLLDARGAQSVLALPAAQVDAHTLNYRTVVVRGHYETAYQILIDNRTYQQQAGFHVVTPLRLEGSELRVLVNRGWLPALAEHGHLPQFSTPDGVVEVRGTALVPPTRFFTLGTTDETRGEPAARWTPLWQHLDLQRYAATAPFPIHQVVIELDEQSAAGGFVRRWARPDRGIATNLGYALQWWAFAATSAALWLILSLRRDE